MENLESTSNQSVWAYKPSWCQPWSIILTGMLIILGSWLVFDRIWLSILVAVPISLWWYYFLIVYPKAYQQIDN